MSGSPKYSRARLRHEQERLLRQARAQQAELERARRVAEEGRRRAERLENVRGSIGGDAAALQQRMADLAASQVGRLVSQEIENIQNRLRDTQAALSAADNLREVQRLGRALRSLEGDLAQAAAQAQTASHAAGLAELQVVRLAMQQRLAALDRTRSERFDPGAVAEVERLLREAGTALDRQASAKARHLLDQVGPRLERHLREVQARSAQWDEERDQCRAALAEAADRVAGLRADDVVVRWAAGEVQALEKQVSQLQAQAGAFAAARAAADAILKQAEETIARAQEKQLAEDRRNYIVRGIVQAMNQMGFVVQAGSPAPEDAGNLASATIIQARRIGGGSVAVSVPQQGDVWYDVAGFPLRTQTGSTGQAVSTCDEAEAQIEKVHAVLADSFGIEMSELHWQGKDPIRIRKQADVLPSAQGAARQQGGGS
jgi:hypothetical protein